MAPVKDIDHDPELGWVFACPTCPFTSRGWESKKRAEQRRAQHRQEHDTREAMPELADVAGRP
jgi:hypothetical protein